MDLAKSSHPHTESTRTGPSNRTQTGHSERQQTSTDTENYREHARDQEKPGMQARAQVPSARPGPPSQLCIRMRLTHGYSDNAAHIGSHKRCSPQRKQDHNTNGLSVAQRQKEARNLGECPGTGCTSQTVRPNLPFLPMTTPTVITNGLNQGPACVCTSGRPQRVLEGMALQGNQAQKGNLANKAHTARLLLGKYASRISHCAAEHCVDRAGVMVQLTSLFARDK